ncbi:glycoprotein antigen BM86 isoform X1 [Ixodes scapularis]
MCKHWQSCEPNPCRYGKCTDQGGKKPRSCSCPRMKDLYENCQIKKEKELSCEEAQAIARIDQNGRVYCDCGPAKTYHNGKCELTGCLNYSKTCQDLCNDNILYKDDRCCEGWNASNCSRPPIASTFCPTGYVRLRGQCREDFFFRVVAEGRKASPDEPANSGSSPVDMAAKVRTSSGNTVVEVPGMDLDPEDCAGWLHVKIGKKNVTLKAKSSARVARRETATATRAARMPGILPKEENKIVVRPRGGLDLARTPVVTVIAATRAAANLSPTETMPDTQ